MDFRNNGFDSSWTSLSYAEKNRALDLRKKQTLALFLERGAISRAQHDESLRALTAEMALGT